MNAAIKKRMVENEQFIKGINDNNMMTDIIRELTTVPKKKKNK